MNTPVETLEFQAEARQLLQLMIHSIYSNKDMFLRELISNASDALDKLRLEPLPRQGPRRRDTSDLHIELDADPEARTLTVRDNGIGMSRDEVVELIGTIAKSGTGELLAQAQGGRGRRRRPQSLIGQFGVGFYSSVHGGRQGHAAHPHAPATARAPAGSRPARARTPIETVDGRRRRAPR